MSRDLNKFYKNATYITQQLAYSWHSTAELVHFVQLAKFQFFYDGRSVSSKYERC